METRKYTADASASAPDMATLTSQGYPIEGNPTLGIRATKPGAAWFYGVGEEIRNAILGAGITPDNGSLDQLASAIAAHLFPIGGMYTYSATENYTVIGRVVFHNSYMWRCMAVNGPDSTVVEPGTDATVWDKIPTASEGAAWKTGDIKLTERPTVEDGFVLGNSAFLSRTTYKNLWEFANDTGKVRTAEEQALFEADPDVYTGLTYGPGDGSTTFQVPDYRGRVLMGADASHLISTYVKAELPNIYGKTRQFARAIASVDPSGAFSDSSDLIIGGLDGHTSTNYVGQVLDASTYDNRYADSADVHPLSATVYALIKAQITPDLTCGSAESTQ